jgi:hypothetical protein
VLFKTTSNTSGAKAQLLRCLFLARLKALLPRTKVRGFHGAGCRLEE